MNTAILYLAADSPCHYVTRLSATAPGGMVRPVFGTRRLSECAEPL